MGDDGRGRRTHVEAVSEAERAGAVARQDGDGGRLGADHGQVDFAITLQIRRHDVLRQRADPVVNGRGKATRAIAKQHRSEEHTSELQSRQYLVCRLLLEKKKNTSLQAYYHLQSILYH